MTRGVMFAAVALAGMLASEARAQSGAPVRALIVTGENNHNWRYTSRYHKETLEESGRFAVDIADDAKGALADAAGLKKYGLIVLDYNGPRWGAAAEKSFAEAVEGGTGVVVIHAANNPFEGWGAYERVCGLVWRDSLGSGHGPFHEFDVRYTGEHPITRGLPGMKSHPDELYHRLANPQKAEFTVLALADSPKDGGSGREEPMAIVLSYGKGRVFHTTLGHVMEEPQKRSIADPPLKLLLARGAEWAATGKVTLGSQWQDQRRHNTLTPEEKAAGWVLLFDGKNPGGLRGYQQPEFPVQGWAAENGELHHQAGKGGGDVITREQYRDFEFACEWKAAPKANSGVIYRATEKEGATWGTGPEMQIIDNAGHHDGLDPKTSAGALYGLIACAYDVIRPAGEWNSFRVLVRGNRVEHWANGFRVVEYELNSPQWDQMIKGTKFEKMEGFGRQAQGHIALQDHGDDVWFRDIKVRALP